MALHKTELGHASGSPGAKEALEWPRRPAEVLSYGTTKTAPLAHAALPVHVLALSASLGRAFPCGRTAAPGPSRARLKLYCASDRLATLASLVVVLRQPPDMVHIGLHPLYHLWLQLGMHIGMQPPQHLGIAHIYES